MIIKRTLPITNCIFDYTGQVLLSSSNEPGIKVVVSKNDSDYNDVHEFNIDTSDVGVKTLSLYKHNYLAYIDENAQVFILSLTRLTTSVSPTWDVLHRKLGIVEKTLVKDDNIICSLHWHPTLPMLAVPGKEGSVTLVVYDEGTQQWSEEYLCCVNNKATHNDNDLIMTQFSLCGSFLASLDAKGGVVIWVRGKKGQNYEAKEGIASASGNEQVTGICWGDYDSNSKSKVSLMLSSPTGYRVHWVDVKRLQADEDAAPLATMPVSTETPITLTSPTRTPSTQKVSPLGGVVALSATEEDGSTPVGGKSLKRLKKSAAAKDDDDEAMFIDQDEDYEVKKEASSTSLSAIKQAVRAPHAEARAAATAIESDDEEEEEDELIDHPISRPIGITTLGADQVKAQIQALFRTHPTVHSGSTRPDEKQRRYLTWTACGNITSREESASNRIEVRFTNQGGKNRNEVFADNFGFTIAAMSLEGALFASPPHSTDAKVLSELDGLTSGSTLYYHAFPGSGALAGHNESFTLTLNNGEAAVCVAVGCGWSAVATSRGLLRVFSSTGVQLSVTALKSPAVCMCAHEDQLAVFIATAPGISEASPAVEVFLYHLPLLASTPVALGHRFVPLHHGALLEWAAFAVDSSALCVLDNRGLMSMLVGTAGTGQWVPVLDIDKVRKSVDHKYWPVQVRDSKLVYVLLNGENKPAVYPQPVVATRLFHVPVVEVKESGRDKAGLSVNDTSSRLVLDGAMVAHYEARAEEAADPQSGMSEAYERLAGELQREETGLDTTLLKLFQVECQLQRLPQAMDLVLRLRTDKGLQTAIKLANHFGRSSLAAKIDALAQQREAQRLQAAAVVTTDDAAPYNQQGGSQQYSAYDDEGPVYGDENISSSPDNYNSNTYTTTTDHYDTYSTSKPSAPPSTRAPANPFLKSSFASPAKKRTGPLAGLADLRASPSPKKPALEVRHAVPVYAIILCDMCILFMFIYICVFCICRGRASSLKRLASANRAIKTYFNSI